MEKKKRKKYSFRQAMRSVTGRVTLLLATLVLPVNLISIGLVYNNYRNTRELVVKEISNSVKIAASNLQMDLAELKKQLLYDAVDNADVIEMREKDEIAPEHRYEVYANVIDILKKTQIVQTTADMLFYYFEKTDQFLSYGGIGISTPEMKQLICENGQAEEDWADKHVIIEYDSKPLLLNMYVYNGVRYGSVVQLNFLSSEQKYMEKSRSREMFLGNADGSIISSDGNLYLSRNGLTLEELRNSSQYYLVEEAVGITGLLVYEIVPMKEINSMVSLPTRLLLVLLSLFAALAVPILIFMMRKLVINPLEDLSNAMDRIEAGDVGYRIQEKSSGIEFEHINANFNAMLDQLDELKIDMYEQQIEQKNVRLKYLSQQIQPHFILNALNILYSYEPEEYDLAQKMIMCISRYFRHIVYANDKFVSLKSEMDHIRNYFEIQKARFPDLFYSIVEYDESIGEALIPPLVIQTIAENSIKHSLKIGNRITIYLIAEKFEDGDCENVRIRLADTGEGISDQVLAEIEAFKETGIWQPHLGVGIQNTIERFKVLYGGGKASIRFRRDPGNHGTDVEIILPLAFRSGNDPEAEEFAD